VAAERADRDANPHAPHVAHAMGHEQVLEAHATHPADGLSHPQVEQRRARHGKNVLRQVPRAPWWRRFAGQFVDLVIWILITAAIISGVLGEWVDAAVILAIVLLNGILGFIQEEKAERALAALQKLAAPQAKVIRGGRAVTLPASELVPGDRVELESGDHVPADVRLIGTAGFRAHEAALTGESVPVDKDHRPVLAQGTALADRVNMAYMGTTAAAGSASGVVVATGMETQIGQIAGLLQRQEPEPTPLQRRLSELGRTLIFVVLAIVAVIFVLQLLRGGKLLDVFLISVSLAVAAVPEGLPAVVTIALALGLQRMARRSALVRRLPSVETLGSVTVICSDKTGTLTRNEMTVREVLAGGRWYDVTGGGYAPEGTFERRVGEDGGTGRVDPQAEPDLLAALEVGARCNHARLSKGADGTWSLIGDPTEAALLVAAVKAGLPDDADRRVVHEVPFDSERKAMSVVLRQSDGSHVMYVKGAPEVILARCEGQRRDGQVRPLNEVDRQVVLEAAHEMAAGALRVLALAYRECVSPDEEDERGLVFAGLAGMIDPPRDEARAAVQRCRSAGIRPVMITGDHPDTARAIGADVGVATDGERVVSGAELDRTSDEELARRVEHIPVYARVTAEHKLRVIAAWRSRGHVVAMTGDGVNDAPAVKAADIGIAMGIAGTDVTKEASDMVLTDDNFASIVNAVEEGRTIFDNIRKFVHYLLATNAGEVLLMFFAALAGWPAPLFAIQILWINLVTDALPALALGVEPAEPDVMSRPPRPPHEPVITRGRGLLMLYHGGLIAAVAAVAFWVIYGRVEANLPAARTAAFCTLAYAQLLFSFGCRSQRYTMPELGPFSNPWLIAAIAASLFLQTAAVTLPFAQPLFKAADLSSWQWLLIAALALMPVSFIEVAKLVRAGLRPRGTAVPGVIEASAGVDRQPAMTGGRDVGATPSRLQPSRTVEWPPPPMAAPPVQSEKLCR
jgi:P-type Ca2+ transporter type 2C